MQRARGKGQSGRQTNMPLSEGISRAQDNPLRNPAWQLAPRLLQLWQACDRSPAWGVGQQGLPAGGLLGSVQNVAKTSLLCPSLPSVLSALCTVCQ